METLYVLFYTRLVPNKLVNNLKLQFLQVVKQEYAIFFYNETVVAAKSKSRVLAQVFANLREN